MIMMYADTGNWTVQSFGKTQLEARVWLKKGLKAALGPERADGWYALYREDICIEDVPVEGEPFILLDGKELIKGEKA